MGETCRFYGRRWGTGFAKQRVGGIDEAGACRARDSGKRNVEVDGILKDSRRSVPLDESGTDQGEMQQAVSNTQNESRNALRGNEHSLLVAGDPVHFGNTLLVLLRRAKIIPASKRQQFKG